jgi:hypothetical protein
VAPPPDLARIIASCAEEADGLGHVTVHGEDPGETTVGLFTAAAGLAEAEESAARVVRRAVAAHSGLSGFAVVSVEAVLVPGPWWGDT